MNSGDGETVGDVGGGQDQGRVVQRQGGQENRVRGAAGKCLLSHRLFHHLFFFFFG